MTGAMITRLGSRSLELVRGILGAQSLGSQQWNSSAQLPAGLSESPAEGPSLIWDGETAALGHSWLLVTLPPRLAGKHYARKATPMTASLYPSMPRPRLPSL